MTLCTMTYNPETGEVLQEYTYDPKEKALREEKRLQEKVLHKDKGKELLPPYKSKSRFTKLYHKVDLPFKKYSYHGYMRCLEQLLEPVSNIVSELKGKEWKPLARKELLKYLKISEAELSRFLAEAKEKRVIAEIDIGNEKKIMLNPVYCLNGTTFDYTVYSIFKECPKLQASLTSEQLAKIRKIENKGS